MHFFFENCKEYFFLWKMKCNCARKLEYKWRIQLVSISNPGEGFTFYTNHLLKDLTLLRYSVNSWPQPLNVLETPEYIFNICLELSNLKIHIQLKFGFGSSSLDYLSSSCNRVLVSDRKRSTKLIPVVSYGMTPSSSSRPRTSEKRGHWSTWWLLEQKVYLVLLIL